MALLEMNVNALSLDLPRRVLGNIQVSYGCESPLSFPHTLESCMFGGVPFHCEASSKQVL